MSTIQSPALHTSSTPSATTRASVFGFTRYGDSTSGQLLTRPVPQPARGDLLVRVFAAEVSPLDAKFRAGQFGTARPLPAGLGLAASGEVEAVGEGVDGFQVGDAVLGPVERGVGAIAQYTIIRAADAVAKPDQVSFDVAATLPVSATTAFDVTHHVDLAHDQTMVLLGASSGVGLMAAQIGRVHKFGVVAVANESERDLVESTGARFVASGPGFADRVRALLPQGADLVVDLVGGEALRQAAPLATHPDRVISTADPNVERLGGLLRPHNPEALEKITSVVAYGLVDPHITATFPLSRAAEALARVEQARAEGTTIVQVG